MAGLKKMSRHTSWLTAGIVTFVVAAFPGPSYGEKGDRLVPANPVGANKNWKTDLEPQKPAQPAAQPQIVPEPQPQAAPAPQPAPAATPSPAPQPTANVAPSPVKLTPAAPEPAAKTLSPEEQQAQSINKINNFFNTLTTLEGRFIQTDSGNNKTRGNFYVKRPGRIRFDYDSPSNLRIVSDSKWLSIEDHDLSTFDRYPLESTPFKLLLKKKVNLHEDADLIDFFKGDDLIIVTVSDKVEKDNGKIKLFFSTPEIQLKEWIITDPQGLDTRVQLTDVTAGKRIKPGFFVVSDETIPIFKR